MSVRCYWFMLATLAVWRLTHLLHAELGPWRCLDRFRRWVVLRLRGGVFECFYCLSLWMAAPVAWLLAEGWLERGLFWLACSGAAILLERAVSRGLVVPRAKYWEDREDEGELLHQDERIAVGVVESDGQ